MSPFLDELRRNFRVADFFDIALISIFIYSLVIWFRRTASRMMVIGLSVLAFIYFLARHFDLYLTSLLFQMVFAVLLVALIVVFQEEIRRGFERIALWGTLRDRRRHAVFPGVDSLLEAVGEMASSRVGALIVIQGREPLERHVEGGIALFGRVSKPLLCSIFDPHSAGHDGAVLVEGDRVSKFAAHLPLSKNLAEIGTLGTRHAAAVGVSERCDCFVIAVSEEQGTIRVAEHGHMDPMSSVAQLKDRLERFFVQRFPRAAGGFDWGRWARENARTKIFAAGLACLFWFFLAYRAETIQRTFAVPIEYRNLPFDWVLEGRKPAEAMVTLSGSERAFRLMNPVTLRLSLDLGSIQQGPQRLLISEEDLRRPNNLRVYRIEPNVIAIEAYPVRLETLPVEPQVVGHLARGLKLTRVKVIPETLRVYIRRSHLDQVEKIFTEPIDLSEITQTTLVRSRVALPEYIQPLESDLGEIRVTVEVEPAGS